MVHSPLQARKRWGRGATAMADGITLGRVSRVTAVPFIATSFLGAALIFLVQPMFARMATPLLGGAPAVWNVSLVCFQAALLGGYAYAHLLSRLKSGRLQVVIHAAVLIAGFACLPLRMSDVMGEPDANNPVFWLIGTFAISIAPPFAALSATAPLVQHWYAKSGLPDAADPYHLYAASNIGSLIGLAAYPLLIEPFAPLAIQSSGWMAGFVVLGAGLLFAGWTVSGASAPGQIPQGETRAAAVEKITWTQRIIWLALAFVPSSLLVGATSHITTDVAAAPFLWAPPLMIYLLTFVVAFSKKPAIPHAVALVLAPLGAAFAALMLTVRWPGVIMLAMGADLLALFLIALACHGMLNARRPGAQHLTQFYLVMSLGGVLGGAFNALIAPVIFDGVFEYPLMLIGSLALLSMGQPKIGRPIWILLAASLAVLVASWAMKVAGVQLPMWAPFVLIAPAVGAIILSRRAPMGAALALACAVPTGWALEMVTAKWSDRSFFGVVKVIDEPSTGIRMMLHGTTIHGAQAIEGDRLKPRMYYMPGTPIQQAFQIYGDAKRIGVTGLGIGSVACFSKPGQDWTFFEIDPLVVQVATDASQFTYMSSCQPNGKIIVGDARVKLRQMAGNSFDFMLLDAFSSDSVPTHLLTLEAMQMYLDKVSADGVLVVHISNRHLKLNKVVARVANAAGAGAVWQFFRASPEQSKAGASSSIVVLVSKSQATLDRARATGLWSDLEADGVRPWTDDYSNIIGAMIDHIREDR
jgi:spermidine synthase